MLLLCVLLSLCFYAPVAYDLACMFVLGIETSCDETAAAVVRDGREIVSSVISSQVPIHKRFGGVVPELASREHLDKIVPVVTEAFERAGITARDIDGIAVTVGPGLVGSLLVGVSYAKAMAYALKKPFVGVNHIEGHIYSVAFENPPIEYPAEALIVSGGHTNIFFIPEPGKYKVVSRTRDDAAGEAFDKVAKLLGLGYPGGPIIERLAREGNPNAVPFSIPRMGDGLPDFSFSGLKTAVTKHVRESGLDAVEEWRRTVAGNKRSRREFSTRRGAIAGANDGTDCGGELSEDADRCGRRGLQWETARSRT